jgi:hypothetical protein
VLRGLEAARDGKISNVEALSWSVDAIEEAIKAGIEREINQAGITLIFPMIITVFGPALVLILFPLVASMIRVLTAFR